KVNRDFKNRLARFVRAVVLDIGHGKQGVHKLRGGQAAPGGRYDRLGFPLDGTPQIAGRQVDPLLRRHRGLTGLRSARTAARAGSVPSTRYSIEPGEVLAAA